LWIVNMSRYGNNIRRIAHTETLNERIRQAEQKLTVLDKAAIPGQRAIAYPNVTQKGSPGATKPDQDGAPDDLDPTDKDPQYNHGVDDNETDGDDLLNGTKVLQPGEDPGALDLKDCETGEGIDVRMNTGANEGEAKFKHPDGWTTTGPSGSAPGWENWQQGLFFEGSGTYFSTSSAPTAELLPENSIGFVSGSFGYEVTDVRNVVVTLGMSGVPIGGTYEAFLDWSSTGTPINTGWGAASFVCTRLTCASVGETNTERCPISAPPAYDNWQEQDPTYEHQLAFSAEDGGFVSSQWDEGLPGKFRNDVGSGRGLNNLQLCTNDGEEVVVSALRDGTFAFFKEDGFGFPEEGEKIFHFDSKGKYLDTMRPDEYEDLRSTNNPAA
jgi:hypothetical protein